MNIIILLTIWQLITIVFNLPIYILPSPLLVIKSFINHYPEILTQAIPTIFEAICGFILSTILGIFSALFLTYFKKTKKWFLPILLISQALPTFAVAPLFVIWFGYGPISKIAVTILMLFFPITSSFYDGLQKTPQEYLNLAHTMNATKFRALLFIKIPAALPYLGNGLRMAATFAPMGAIIGEWVGSSKGLGFLILNANSKMEIDLMFAALFVLACITLLFYFTINKLLKQVITWE